MKSKFAWGAFRKAPAVLLVAVAVALSTGSLAHAVEIAYEGFGYPDGGYLTISDASTPELIEFGINDAGIYDGFDDGTAGFYDHDNDPGTPDIQDTVLGDPARAGGSGSWVANAGWIRRTVTGAGVSKINGNETLSYTDSNGDSLVTTMGKPEFFQWAETWRAFDASTVVDPAYPQGLTIPNTGSENTISAIDFEVPTLGKHGTVVWMSFLGDRGVPSASNDSGPDIQLYNKRDAVSLTETPKDRTGGIGLRLGVDTRYFDSQQGTAEGSHEKGVNGDVAGSLAADALGDVFHVVKFDYGATSGTGETDGWADVTFWVNPDLDTEPDVADAGLVTTGYLPINAIYINDQGVTVGCGNIGDLLNGDGCAVVVHLNSG